MKLSVKGLTWGCAFLMLAFYVVLGIVNVFYPGYGAAYINLEKSFYPGFSGAWATVKDWIVGAIYFFVGGLISGLFFALFYNAFAGKGKKKAAPRRAAVKRSAPKKKKATGKKKKATSKKKSAKKRPAKRKR
jgi:hypothetical protein